MSAGRKNNSAKKDWNTPPKYINAIKSFWRGEIDLDPCSNSFSLVGAKTEFLYPNNNGLLEDWSKYKSIFINPPYGRDTENKTSLYNWINKGLETKAKNFNSEIIYLIPVATNTKHFKNIVFKKFSVICFLEDTRLKFYNQGKEDKKGAPMACCLIYLGNNSQKFIEYFSEYGKCLLL